MKISCIRILMLLAVMLSAVSANAFTFRCTWNIPGAVEIRTDSYLSGPVIGPSSEDATAFDTEFPGQTWVYLVAKEGYKIVDATLNGDRLSPSFGQGRMYVGKFVNSASEMAVTLAPVDESAVFYVDMENGADWISTVLSDGTALELVNGENTVYFDPDIVEWCRFSLTKGVKDFYSFTVNGESREKANYWETFIEVNPVVDGDRIVIRVFENEEPVITDCVVTLSLPEGFDDCIKSVFDRTYDEWLTFVDGKLTVKSNSELNINFVTDDYIYDSFTMNGVDVTELFNNGTLRVVIDEDTDIVVEGSVRIYGEVDFTAYVMNPEGVRFYRGWYRQNPVDLAGSGEPITAPIQLNAIGSTIAITMLPENTNRIEVSVTEKRPYIYIAPQDGWFIYTVQAKEGGVMTEENIITEDTRTFYVVAFPLSGGYQAKVNVIGDGAFAFTSSEVRSKLWDNPSTVYDLVEGENTISFIPLFDLPITVRSRGTYNNFSVYLDGASLNADDNGLFEVKPYYPADGGEQTKESVITVNVCGSALQTTRVRVEPETGISAALYYGDVMTSGNINGQNVLRGTQMAIHPSTTDCRIILDGEVLHGCNAEGVMVDGLDENGDYCFTAKGGSMTFEVLKGASAGITGIEGDAEGRVTVYSIDGRKLYENAPEEVYGNLERGLYIINGRKVLIGD